MLKGTNKEKVCFFKSFWFVGGWEETRAFFSLYKSSSITDIIGFFTNAHKEKGRSKLSTIVFINHIFWLLLSILLGFLLIERPI